MNYQNIISYASIFSGFLIVANNFLGKEYLDLFLRFSWGTFLGFASMTSLGVVGTEGYKYYLKRIEDSNTSSYDGIVDTDCPLIIEQKICRDSFYFVKLGDLEYVFIIVPTEKEAKLLISKEKEGMIRGLSLTVADENLELSSKEFWYGTVKIIKL
jgi:hypothetical protein